jgi:ribonuclease Y
MDALPLILALVAGVAVGLIVARVLGLGRSQAAERAAEAEAGKLIEGANAEVAEILEAAKVEGSEVAFKLKKEAEEASRARRSELAKKEEELKKRERAADKRLREAKKKEADFAAREKSLESREKAAESMADAAEEAREKARAELERIAGMSRDQARDSLADEMRAVARERVADEIAEIEVAAEKQALERSQTIIATAIQRYANEFVGERTVSVVPLPSDDMKGRLIGREGRNIRALEAAAGIDMIIDDTSEVITISCFNPVRREIARRAVAKLVADGRIHPTRIEEVVRDCEKQIDAACVEAGEQAVFDLGLHKVHPELVKHLGRLKHRMAYAHNVLDHSIEVGFLAGLMAAEIGISVKAARRAGLLHDIGKGVDHEHEGSHAEVGADLARKHGEAPRIVSAIAHHHEGAASVLDHIVDAANRLSSARPGARRELLASYIKRLENLEQLAAGYEGVDKVFALQAGREVRVMVQNDRVDDARARMLAKDIAQRIEKEASYPGQVRVVVIRETRASDYAH